MPMMIVFDKLTYIPGQIVTGHVVIVSKSPQKVKGLTMRFIGRSSKLLGDVEGTKRYKKEVYFDEKMDIFGHDGSNTQIRVGETLYPFTFPLPPGLPSSFEWPDGNVLYFVEAKLTRASWKDKRVSSRIKVEGVFDLNLEPNVLSPVEVKRQKYVKHLLTKSGPYGFTFKCNRSGFVRGHSLPFSLDVRNLSKVDSRKLRVSLLQEVKSGEGKPIATLVEQVKGPAVTAGEVVTWEARLKIPSGIPPTNLGNILNYPSVVPVYYLLHVQLSLKNCREDPICIKIPVTIGTISVQRRAISVPALDDDTINPFIPYSNNGHRMDCPMSQLLTLPSAAISTSQFSPHLVQVNTATSYTHTQVTRVPNNAHHHNHNHTLATRTLSHRTPPVQILGPVRQYEYYFEYDDSAPTATTTTAATASRSATRGETLPTRRRNQNRNHHPNYSTATTGGRHFYHGSSAPVRVRESPPPSYDEIFTLPRYFNATPEPGRQATRSHNNSNSNNEESPQEQQQPQQSPEIIVTRSTPGPEVVHKRVLSTQLSTSSSSSTGEEDDEDEDDDDDENDNENSTTTLDLQLVSPNGNNNSNSNSNANCNANTTSGNSNGGRREHHDHDNDSPASDEEEDDDNEVENDDDEEEDEDDEVVDNDDETCSVLSTNDEFLSCSGSSSSFDELKCHHENKHKNMQVQNTNGQLAVVGVGNAKFLREAFGVSSDLSESFA